MIKSNEKYIISCFKKTRLGNFSRTKKVCSNDYFLNWVRKFFLRRTYFAPAKIRRTKFNEIQLFFPKFSAVLASNPGLTNFQYVKEFNITYLPHNCGMILDHIVRLFFFELGLNSEDFECMSRNFKTRRLNICERPWKQQKIQ